jgi:hypothetical protein
MAEVLASGIKYDAILPLKKPVSVFWRLLKSRSPISEVHDI